MDAAVRVREMNEAREKIGGEPFLDGDDAIKEAFEYGLCHELVLDESYNKTLQHLKDTKRERKRIADSKPTVKEEFYSNGKLQSRANYQPKSDGGKKHGLQEWYHENGQLAAKTNTKDGKQHGLHENYHENGQLSLRVNYKDGKEDGLEESYQENGQLWTKSNWKDGELDGYFEVYAPNGQFDYKDCYKNGKKTDMSYCEK